MRTYAALNTSAIALPLTMGYPSFALNVSVHISLHVLLSGDVCIDTSIKFEELNELRKNADIIPPALLPVA